MARFVLAHGSWHAGWCWQSVADELERRGHVVSCPDLPCEDAELGAAEYAARIGSNEETIVVGHSLAGLMLPLVPGAIHVFVSAIVPTPGKPGPFGDALAVELATERDDLGRSYWPSAEIAGEQLYPELSRDTVEQIFPRLRPQAQKISNEPSPVRRLPEHSAYIVCARDRIVRPAWQEWAAEELLGVAPAFLDCGHFPMYEKPGELADLLERLHA